LGWDRRRIQLSLGQMGQGLLSISEGSLGFRNLKTFNRALLGKGLWRYGFERDAWWRVVVDSKYGSLRGGWCSLEPIGAFGVGVWKNIRKGWDSFSRYTRFIVGDGSKISFWHDLWCGDTVLKVAFPTLFDIARLKDVVVADNLERLGDSFQWNVGFIREADDWEVDVFASFFQLLHSIKVNRDTKDSLWWVPSKKGVFKVKAFFYSLTSAGGGRFPWKSIWHTQASPRLLSLCGLQLWVRSSLRTTLGNGMLL
jgi:hypothetical protein